MVRKLTTLLIVCFLWMFTGLAEYSYAGISMGDDDIAMGMPIGGGSEAANVDLCPHGARVVETFLYAWRRKDYRMMYDLLDAESKRGYPFERAKLDLRFLKYKEYKISSVRRDGDNFEFLLTYGDWKDGDKDVKKMVINGKTFKIIMPTRNSPFKKSLANYF